MPTPVRAAAADPGGVRALSPSVVLPRMGLVLVVALATGAMLAAIEWDQAFPDTSAGVVAIVLSTLAVLGFSAALRSRAALGAYHWAPAGAPAVIILAALAVVAANGLVRTATLTALLLVTYAATLALFSRRPYDGASRLEAITLGLAAAAIVASIMPLDAATADLEVMAVLHLMMGPVTVMAATGMIVSQGWVPTRSSALVLTGAIAMTTALLLGSRAGSTALDPGPLLLLGAFLTAGGLTLGDSGVPPPDRGLLAARVIAGSVAVLLGALLANGLREHASSIAAGAAFGGLITAFTRIAVRGREQVRTDPAQLGGVDRLTGLPDRYELEAVLGRELEHAERHRHPLGLAIIDVVSLHEINETLGHRVGDHVLRELAASLAALSDADVPVRLSGGSFALVLRSHKGTRQLRARLEAVLSQLPPRLELDDVPMVTRTRTGLAFYPEHARNVADLLRRAEVAVQEAKDTGQALLIYDPARDVRSRERLQLAAELREGIERDELRVYFQPKIDLATGVVIGAEALVRWRHPDGQLLLPDEFLSIAERTGQMDALTSWVLDAALREVRRWREHGYALQVAVNISAESLLDETLPERLHTALARHGLRGAALELEITEELAMADPARTAGIVGEIKALGVGVALDDFGTGYSSLSHLKHLGVDVLKIDQSFVRNIASDKDDRVIVWTILDLARNLGMRAVAEGVDSADAVAMLAMMGCAVGQGFHYARPLDADAFLLWCMEQQRQGTIRLTAAAIAAEPSS